jgi:hypothetical protein
MGGSWTYFQGTLGGFKEKILVGGSCNSKKNKRILQ